MHREEVPGQRDLGRIVKVKITAVGHARVVRIAEGQIHEEGPPARLFKKMDRLVNDLPARLAAAAFRFVVQVQVVLEAGLDRQSRVASLAVVVGLVAGGAHGVRKIRSAGGCVEAVAEERAAAQQHVAAGQAYSGRIAAHAVGVVKHHAGARQSIQVRGLDMRIAEGGNRIGALVVGEQKQYVQAALGRGGKRRPTPCTRAPEPTPAVPHGHRCS